MRGQKKQSEESKDSNAERSWSGSDRVEKRVASGGAISEKGSEKSETATIDVGSGGESARPLRWLWLQSLLTMVCTVGAFIIVILFAKDEIGVLLEEDSGTPTAYSGTWFPDRWKTYAYTNTTIYDLSSQTSSSSTVPFALNESVMRTLALTRNGSKFGNVEPPTRCGPLFSVAFEDVANAPEFATALGVINIGNTKGCSGARTDDGSGGVGASCARDHGVVRSGGGGGDVYYIRGAQAWFSVKGMSARVGFCVRKHNTSAVRAAMFPFSETTKTLNPPVPTNRSNDKDDENNNNWGVPNCSVAIPLVRPAGNSNQNVNATSFPPFYDGENANDDDENDFVWQAFSSPRVNAVGLWVAALGIICVRFIVDLICVGVWFKLRDGDDGDADEHSKVIASSSPSSPSKKKGSLSPPPPPRAKGSSQKRKSAPPEINVANDDCDNENPEEEEEDGVRSRITHTTSAGVAALAFHRGLPSVATAVLYMAGLNSYFTTLSSLPALRFDLLSIIVDAVPMIAIPIYSIVTEVHCPSGDVNLESTDDDERSLNQKQIIMAGVLLAFGAVKMIVCVAQQIYSCRVYQDTKEHMLKAVMVLKTALVGFSGVAVLVITVISAVEEIKVQHSPETWYDSNPQEGKRCVTIFQKADELLEKSVATRVLYRYTFQQASVGICTHKNNSKLVMDTILQDKGIEDWERTEWDGTSATFVNEDKVRVCDYNSGEVYMTFTHHRIFYMYILWVMSLGYLFIKVCLEIIFGIPYALSESFRKKAQDEDREVFGCAANRAYDVLLADGILVPAVSAPIFFCTNNVPELQKAPLDWRMITIILDCIPGIALPAYALFGCTIGIQNAQMVAILLFGIVRCSLSILARFVGIVQERVSSKDENERSDAEEENEKRKRKKNRDVDDDDDNDSQQHAVVVYDKNGTSDSFHKNKGKEEDKKKKNDRNLGLRGWSGREKPSAAPQSPHLSSSPPVAKSKKQGDTSDGNSVRPYDHGRSDKTNSDHKNTKNKQKKQKGKWHSNSRRRSDSSSSSESDDNRAETKNSRVVDESDEDQNDNASEYSDKADEACKREEHKVINLSPPKKSKRQMKRELKQQRKEEEAVCADQNKKGDEHAKKATRLMDEFDIGVKQEDDANTNLIFSPSAAFQ